MNNARVDSLRHKLVKIAENSKEVKRRGIRAPKRFTGK